MDPSSSCWLTDGWHVVDSRCCLLPADFTSLILLVCPDLTVAFTAVMSAGKCWWWPQHPTYRSRGAVVLCLNHVATVNNKTERRPIVVSMFTVSRSRRWWPRGWICLMKSARCQTLCSPCGPTPCGKRRPSNCSALCRGTPGPSSSGQNIHLTFGSHVIQYRLYWLKLLTVGRYKGGVPVDPLSAPGKYKIENKYGVHSLIISRYGANTVICRVTQRFLCFKDFTNKKTQRNQSSRPRARSEEPSETD